MGEPTVVASLTSTLIQAAEAEGYPVAALLRRAELSNVSFEDPEGRIPFRNHAALWESVLELSRERPFGLILAEQQATAASYGIAGYISKTSPTVGDGFRKAIEYLRLITERGVGTVTDEPGGGLRLAISPSATSGVARHHTESILAAMVVLGRRWAGTTFAPIQVQFQHAAPPDTSRHEALFGCPVTFGAEDSAIVIDQEVAALRLRTADSALHLFLCRRADSLLAALPAQSDLLKDVEAIVREQIAEGAPTVSFIARRLGLSSRTLQRRLASEGVSYASLLDRYRRETALKLLDDDRFAIHDVSMMLGFSEPKAFRRAFKRWTGLSPRAHRNRRRLGHLSVAA